MAILCPSCGGAGHVTVSLALHSGLGGVNATGAIVCTRCQGARWVPDTRAITRTSTEHGTDARGREEVEHVALQ